WIDDGASDYAARPGDVAPDGALICFSSNDRLPHGEPAGFSWSVCDARESNPVLCRYSVTGGLSPLWRCSRPPDRIRHVFRSEEHTSELQSREKLVCCLLL